ncbi:DNA polymerase I [Thermodesulfovibrio hydrogeniphilus]
MEKEIYLLDGSCFVYRAYHAIKDLRNSKGTPTNATYGFTRMLLRLLKEKNVNHMLIAFDSPHPTKRHKVYEDYKVTRPETPKDLPIQIDYIKKIVDSLGISRIELPGYEADDIIASVVEKLKDEDFNFYIVTLDKDMMQIVSDRVKIYDPFNDLLIDKESVLKKFGVLPEKLTDFMALVGDSIDNIPGVKGIGEKTAAELIKRYGSVENILKNIAIIKPSKVAELIRKNENSLKLSKELVFLNKDAPIDIKLEELKIKEPDRENLIKIFQELEFRSLIKEILPEEQISTNITKAEKKDILSTIYKKGLFSLTLSDSKAIVGVDNLIAEFDIPEKQLYELMSSNLMKILYNAKDIFKFLSATHYSQATSLETPITPPFFDLMIAAYLLNPNKAKYDLNELLLDYLGTIYNKELSIQLQPSLMLKLYEKLMNELKEKELDNVYYDIEMPLVEVLYEMEKAGIKVDERKLNELTAMIEVEIEKIKNRIYNLTGFEFNINSPKQLAEVLYDKLGLKSRKKGKKARSTEMEVLEELALQHELPQEVINYRILNKLFTSYLIPLKNFINPSTKRIHPKWSQTVASTGRLISSEPNLQNIPVKGQWAEYLREVFVPEEGCLFLSADYSQIELRLLAHLSEDQNLIDAFIKGKDIHKATAMELFSISENQLTEEHRRIAKTVNFGITYGISAFGLSESIKFPYEKAEELIDLYFLRYPKVKDFIEQSINFAREKGFVKTLFGRIRPIPEIKSPNQNLRQQAERMAVNARVQGSAADIIKIAMTRIYHRIKQENLNARIIIQIHDEIVIESHEKNIDRVKQIVDEEMKNFSLHVPLEVNIYTGKSLNL